jgi:hypothetical protein
VASARFSPSAIVPRATATVKVDRCGRRAGLQVELPSNPDAEYLACALPHRTSAPPAFRGTGRKASR